jgi:hypothetical protein
MKCAVVYERKEVFYISTSSQTTTGLWIDEEPCIAIKTDSSYEELGKAVRKALDSSRANVPHPKQTEWGNVTAPLLKAAGVKSWSTFGKTAKCSHIEMDKQLVFIPTKNFGGRSGGFRVIEGKSFELATDAKPEQIGESVKKAMSFSELA